MKHKIMSEQTYKRLRLTDGRIVDQAPYEFVSDGTIGVFPRFVGPSGTLIFLHAVEMAEPSQGGTA